MSTSYSVPIEAFYHRIEKDRDFFNYFNLSEEEAMALAKERALAYMDEALVRISLECHPSVDFTDRDDTSEVFNFDLNKNEVMLISSLMYQSHLEREIPYLKTMDVNYTPSELKVFDPSNARSSYLDMYKIICEQNDSLMDKYKSTDRVSGTYKTINFNSYDDE